MEMVSLPKGEDLEEIATAICAEAGIGGATGAVVEMARRCLASRVLRDGSRGGEVFREVPFVTERAGKVLIGRIDLVTRSNGEVVVIDYKTDAVEAGAEATAAEVHRGQIGVYEHAVRTAAETRAVIKLLFARTGADIEVRVGP